jgi:hypothetical protein
MKHKIILVISSAFLILFSACNPYTSWEKTVVNDSSKTVILYTTDSGGGFTFTDSVIIAPSTSKLIYAFDDITNVESAECDLYVSRLTLTVESPFEITKDIQDGSNWASSSKDAGQGFNHTCVYTLTDDDIQ